MGLTTARITRETTLVVALVGSAGFGFEVVVAVVAVDRLEVWGVGVADAC
jgi:hypothetical protein